MSKSAPESWQRAAADAAHAQVERGHLRCVGGHVPDRVRLWKFGNNRQINREYLTGTGTRYSGMYQC